MAIQHQLVQPIDSIGGVLAFPRQRQVVTNLAIVLRKIRCVSRRQRWLGFALLVENQQQVFHPLPQRLVLHFKILLLHRDLIFLAHQPARCRVQLIHGAVGLF